MKRKELSSGVYLIPLMDEQYKWLDERYKWRYGNSPQWARYSLRLARRLTKAGIPDVQRRKVVWYNDPATAQWEVSFPKIWLEEARRIADRMKWPD
jgi:hypothetical protein